MRFILYVALSVLPASWAHSAPAAPPPSVSSSAKETPAEPATSASAPPAAPASAPSAAAATSPKIPAPLETPLPTDRMGVSVHRLSNGLTVYLSPNHIDPHVAALIAVRTGSKNDPAVSTGMAHYLEHMLFKGSTRLGTLDYEKEKPHLDRITQLYDQLFREKDPGRRKEIYGRIDRENIEAAKYEAPNEIDRLYTSLGFDGVNAHTSEESTVYECSFPANRAEVWARLEADRFAHPVFRLFQSELEAVYEEKNRSMDNAGRILNEALEAALYKNHPYGRTVLGSIEHLKNPSLSTMYSYFHANYRPGNMAIVLSGDFERNPMLKLLEETFGAWKPEPLPGYEPPPLPKPRGVERVEVKYEAEEQVVIAWPTVPVSHPDYEALVVMDMALDNSQAGILNLALNQQQRVKSSGSYPEFRNDAGAWFLWAVPKASQTLEEAEALLMGTVDKLKAGDFSEDDLKAIITDFEVGEKKKLESNWARASEMEGSFIAYQEWPYTAGYLDRLRRVTKADVLRAAAKYLGPDRVVAYRREGKPAIPSIQKPDFTKIDIDPTRKSAFYAELEKISAKPIEPRWLEAGRDFTVQDFPWGKLYAAKNPVNDLFSVTFEFDRGRKHERDLCEAFGLLGLSGAWSMTAEAYKKALYALGASMSVSCGEDGSSVSLSGIEENYDKSLDLMFARFESPNVATDTLKKMVDVEIGAHRDEKKDPGAVGYALREFAMRGKESEVLGELTDAELRALDEGKLKDLLRHALDFRHKALYVGVRDPAAAAARFCAGRVQFAPEPPYEPHHYIRADKPRVLFTHRDMVQARVGLYAADTVVDPSRAVDEQYYNAYMDGGMSGVIFQEVREARALAYSASGGYGAGGRKGDQNVLWARAGCQADKTLEAGRLLGELLGKMPVSKDRFAEAKKSMEESYRTDYVQFRGIPGTVLYWDQLGIGPRDPRPARFRRVLAYGLDDLTRFARNFGDRAMTFHVLGPRDHVDLDGLKKLGDFQELKLDQLFPY